MNVLKVALLAAVLAAHHSVGQLSSATDDTRGRQRLQDGTDKLIISQGYDAEPNPPTVDWRYIEYGTTMLQAAYLDQPYCVVHDRSAEEQRWVCVVTSDSSREGGPGEHLVR